MRDLMEPRTDWQPLDGRSVDDHARIHYNYEVIRDNLAEFYGAQVTLQDNLLTQPYSDVTALAINHIEQNLYLLWRAWGSNKEVIAWQPAQRPTYLDFIRWEAEQEYIDKVIRSSIDYIPRCGVGIAGANKLYQVRWRRWNNNSLHAYVPLLQGMLAAGQGLQRQVDYRKDYVYRIVVEYQVYTGIAACGQARSLQNAFIRRLP